jgi:prolipoprotein diacylglyceryltransferase
MVLHVPAGVFLDVTAPGLLFAMAVGRVGCFFAGCCGGPPTASCWGVWSSDQHVGARRIPTQLLESVLAFSLGLWGCWWRSWVTGRRVVPSSLRGWRLTPWGDKVFCICAPSRARRG